jgi:hypothetical protein
MAFLDPGLAQTLSVVAPPPADIHDDDGDALAEAGVAAGGAGGGGVDTTAVGRGAAWRGAPDDLAADRTFFWSCRKSSPAGAKGLLPYTPAMGDYPRAQGALDDDDVLKKVWVKMMTKRQKCKNARRPVRKCGMRSSGTWGGTWYLCLPSRRKKRPATLAYYIHDHSSTLSQLLLESSAAPPVLQADASYLARRVLERGLTQLLGTLTIALTSGLATPAVGGACAVAAAVQLVHHTNVLGQIAGFGEAAAGEGQATTAPGSAQGRNTIPATCAALLAGAVLAFWSCAAFDFLVYPAVTGGAAGGFPFWGSQWLSSLAGGAGAGPLRQGSGPPALTTRASAQTRRRTRERC